MKPLIAIWISFLIISLPVVFADQQNQYDGIGRLTNDGNFVYEWNDFGELARINNTNGNVVEEYFYDDDGIRQLTLKYNSSV